MEQSDKIGRENEPHSIANKTDVVCNNDEERAGESEDDNNQGVLAADEKESQTSISAAKKRIIDIRKEERAVDSGLEKEVDDNINQDEPTNHPG